MHIRIAGKGRSNLTYTVVSMKPRELNESLTELIKVVVVAEIDQGC
jgi:hypothetical protein